MEYDIFGDSDDAKCLDRRAARLRDEAREKEEEERGEEEEEREEGEGRAVDVVGGASVAEVRTKAVGSQRENSQHVVRVKGARRDANANVNANGSEPDVAAADMWRIRGSSEEIKKLSTVFWASGL